MLTKSIAGQEAMLARRRLSLFANCNLLIVAAAFVLLFPAHVLAQGVSAEDANRSNNPLNPAPGLNFQNVYTPELYGSNSHTNDFLLRGTLPIAPGETIKAPQIVRLTVPVSTRPAPGGGNSTGLGDINIFDIFLLAKTSGGVELGAGPLLVMPTASKDELGTGKWQGGVAAIAMHPSPKGILGGLVQWQASFAGDSDRPDVSTLTAQPFWIHNLAEGWYVRSTGIWSFNLKNDDYYIPIGFGAGKVWKSGTTTLNAFVEPQWTVTHEGNNLPKFSVFFGLNLTLGR
jgi:hypothetical protein